MKTQHVWRDFALVPKKREVALFPAEPLGFAARHNVEVDHNEVESIILFESNDGTVRRSEPLAMELSIKTVAEAALHRTDIVLLAPESRDE